ncbi:MAG: AAA family ATPase [Gammaproteobacteria bacterium]|nr:AAA family ATPase [Gammaproteobacteria bacterium]
MKLTTEQEHAVSSAVNAISNNLRYVIKGYAGTGKTTSLIELVRRCQEQGFKICLTAPTNKAVDVIRRTMRQANVSVDIMTTFKLLGLAIGTSEGKKILKRGGQSSVKNYRAVIIDECSMVGDELLKYLNQDCESFISIGDPMQLPPVNEVESGAFHAGQNTELKTVIRQAAENPIISASMLIREMIDKEQFDLERLKQAFDMKDRSGIIEATYQVGLQWMMESFKSRDFEDDNDKFRCVAWTNRTVNMINKMAYNHVYDNPDTPFMHHQTVVLRNNAMEAFYVNQELVVTSLIQRDVVYRPDGRDATVTSAFVENPDLIQPVQCWDVGLIDEDGNEEMASCVDDIVTHKQNIEAIKSVAKKHGAVWPLFFSYIDYYADLRHPYAMTVHCSQGSTFENQFLMLDDILKNPNTREMMQMLYVAVTRPSNCLVVM